MISFTVLSVLTIEVRFKHSTGHQIQDGICLSVCFTLATKGRCWRSAIRSRVQAQKTGKSCVRTMGGALPTHLPGFATWLWTTPEPSPPPQAPRHLTHLLLGADSCTKTRPRTDSVQSSSTSQSAGNRTHREIRSWAQGDRQGEGDNAELAAAQPLSPQA